MRPKSSEKGGGRELNSRQRHSWEKMLKKSANKKVVYVAMTLLIALEIFFFSSINMPVGGETESNLSFLYHLGVFFMFTFFLSLSLINKKADMKIIAAILLISLIYAVSDEFHQLFVIGRFASAKDVLTDFTGSLCSLLLIKIMERHKKL